MDFLLGIFTGIALCFIYSHYLVYQNRKHQRQQQKQALEFWHRVFNPNRDLEQQLQDAIDREDFDEAARLRDLINRR